MTNILYGLLFIFLDFNLSLNSHTIDIGADFIGFALILNTLTNLDKLENSFSKATPFIFAGLITSALSFSVDLFGYEYSFIFIRNILSLSTTILMVFGLYYIILALFRCRNVYNIDFECQNLYSIFKVYVILTLVSTILPYTYFVPFYFISFPLSAAAFVLFIVFLVAFNKSSKLFNRFFGL